MKDKMLKMLKEYKWEGDEWMDFSELDYTQLQDGCVLISAHCIIKDLEKFNIKEFTELYHQYLETHR